MSNSGLRRSLETWFHAVGVRPRLVAELEDPAFVSTLASYGLGFTAQTRYRFRAIGQTEECRQQFYAITAECKRSHPAVEVILAKRPAVKRRIENRNANNQNQF
jgi:LysR family transcriptional regulator, transcriptional activator of nhaA